MLRRALTVIAGYRELVVGRICFAPETLVVDSRRPSSAPVRELPVNQATLGVTDVGGRYELP
jgi:hypothetical protein